MMLSNIQAQLSTHEDRLRGFALSLTRNEEEARDLFQETAYRILKYVDKFTPDTNFKAWAMTIMKNTFINNYRRKKRQNTFSDTTDEQYFINSTQQTAINEGESNLTMKELNRLIMDLPDPVRLPFLMHFRGFKYKEIAREFNLPLGTVKSRIFFARKALQEKIKIDYTRTEVARGN